MRTTIEKALSLGLGLAIAGKEQVEKTVEELVKKGEVSKNESKDLINHLIQKGEEMKVQLEAVAKEKVNAAYGELKLATLEDVKKLEKRIEALERKNLDE
ncbi:phasin family protein [Niallia sp. FSL K6-0077]|uniref:phasin family protein n=1 Tax=Niallia sp. FSL K6-0077 TaxID=2954743 RepID=UPI0030F9F846